MLGGQNDNEWKRDLDDQRAAAQTRPPLIPLHVFCARGTCRRTHIHICTHAKHAQAGSSRQASRHEQDTSQAEDLAHEICSLSCFPLRSLRMPFCEPHMYASRSHALTRTLTTHVCTYVRLHACTHARTTRTHACFRLRAHFAHTCTHSCDGGIHPLGRS